MTTIRIGILAVQGAFVEHERMLRALGCECVELRKPSDIDRVDGLVLPGGESSVQGMLVRQLGLFEPLRREIVRGTPVLATCAGMILLAEKIRNDPRVYFGTLPIEVDRHAYGRQLASFRKTARFDRLGDFETIFIRAPRVVKKGDDVRTLAVVDDAIVAVAFRNQLAMAFHPELGRDDRIHRRFISLINARRDALNPERQKRDAAENGGGDENNADPRPLS